MIHFVMSVEEGVRDLPLILSGSTPVNEGSGLGSKRYSRFPKAVVLGGGYDDEAITRLREAVAVSPGTIKVPWLKADPNKTKAGPTPGTDEYCRSAASRMKHTLGTLLETEDPDLTDDEILFW